MPLKLKKIGRTAINGSFFNFYLCEFQGNVKIPGQTPLPIKYDTSLVNKDREVPPPMSNPFRQRNPVPIGAISIAVILVLLVVAFRAQDMPLIGGGDTYQAAFAESGGLKPNDEVRIAGVRVGKVTEVELDGNKVIATFKVKTPSKFGDETAAAIKVKTLLGAMFISLEPAGSGQLKEDTTIPVSRTTSPYNVVQAFSGLADRAERIDTDRLAKSIDTLAALTKDTPAAFQSTLQGLSRLSETVASRNDQIGELLREPGLGLRDVGGA